MIRKEAKWVTAAPECEAPIFYDEVLWERRDKKAVISICGLGFFELYINGRKVSEELLVPAWSDYEPRKNRRLLYPITDSFTHRIYYLDYEITGYLKEGKNCLEVWLGNGWYNQHERNVEGDLWYGSPKLAFSIEIDREDGGRRWQNSDENMTWQIGPISFNNVYYGEKWDFSRTENAKRYGVNVIPSPESQLCRQTCPADRETKVSVPRLIKEDGSRRVYDAGVNLTGYVRCSGKGHIRIRYAEEIDGKGELDFASTGGIDQIQCDEYRTEEVRVLKPKFSVKGFRYFEIVGAAEDVRVITVHSDVAVTSGFQSDNETLNWLYEAYVRTQLNNMHYGVVSDCPHRERLGYTGDGQLACRAGMMLLDSRELYRKWIRDILDCQDMDSGHVQHTAPFYGGGGGPGGWGSAVVMVPWQFYLQYGETEILKECYPHMRRWFFYMKNHSENGLVVREEKDGWCLGDWCPPGKVTIPEPLVNTYYFVKAMQCMLKIGEILGVSDDRKEMEAQLKSALWAMKVSYYQKPEKMVQGAESFLADIGIGDERDLAALREKYEKGGAYDTGIFGTYVLTKVLLDNGFSDTAFQLLTSSAENASFEHMRKSGATTLWENWNGTESHDHPMFGAVTECLFSGFLGIEAAAPGYTEIRIAPQIPACINYMEGKLQTAAGRVEVSFDRTKERPYKITVPDAPAVLCLNGEEIPLQAGENIF